MGPGLIYAIATVTIGCLLLLGWLYATTGNPRSWALLRRSLLFFVLPIALMPTSLFQFPLGLWALVAFEEGLKAFASSREKEAADKFFLVALFGIWELTLDKPFWGLTLEPGTTWTGLELVGIIYATALPALMHVVTAAIYAYKFQGKLWAAFATSWLVHTVFNEVASYFEGSALAVIVETTLLVAIMRFLLNQARKSEVANASEI